MRRTTLTLMALIAATVIWVGTAQAAPAVSINAGLASQTLARHGHGHRHGHKHYRHQRHHGHHGHHYRHRHHPRYIHHPPVIVHPPVYYGYGYNTGGFHYSGRNFSFGFGY